MLFGICASHLRLLEYYSKIYVQFSELVNWVQNNNSCKKYSFIHGYKSFYFIPLFFFHFAEENIWKIPKKW